MQEFVHLHLHSEYSLLDGAIRISDIPKHAAECGHSAVAITDHGVMYGAVAFYRACRAAGIKPIIGCEVYVAPRSRFDKTNSGEGYASHLVLLCKNETGYKNLIAMVSKSFTEGFYMRPRVDAELLRAHSEGLIALSACLAGKIPRLLSKGDYAEAVATAREYSDIFGKDNFYIELQNHGLQEQLQILPSLVKLAEECDLPLVATNDCHYTRRQDASTQAVLMCIQTNSTLDEGRPIGFETDEFYYKDTNEMKMLFGKYEGAIENTVKIAERCNLDFDFDNIYLPRFVCPDNTTPIEHLRALAEAGLESRSLRGHIVYGEHSEEEYRRRAEYELSVIDSMGYADYFLIVQDYVNFAKSHSIPVGPGRGSGAGSLVAYLVGITDVDPIKFDLLFERFLNPERVSMPDFDIDFCYNRRDEVIQYVAEKYGADHVSQIITFGTLAAKAAVRDVGRVMGMPYGDVDAVAKAIPRELGITIEDALKSRELREMYNSSDKVKQLIDTAKALEGMPRNISIHAAGVVITDKPVSTYVPLSTSGDIVVTQYDMDTIASLGLLKFDFLALRYLTIINDAQTQIREREPDFDINKIDLADKATYALISRGNTAGVFQLESGGMKQMLTSFCPRNIDDILAAISLYRPGPMESIPTYIERKKDPSKIKYATPLLEPILKSTYGCVVYQEQVMNIFRTVAGYTFGHADIVRRAMSKKKASVLEAERESFIEGAVKNGVSREVADNLFDEMSDFAKYAFNKSHAAAYAMISYRTAYLKTHYPKEYMAALLTSVLGSPPKIAEYIDECHKFSFGVLPPDINESGMYFQVGGEHLRFGLLALKNVGKQFVSEIIRERKRRPFSSFSDFIDRMADRELNKRQVESLIKSGAFDGLGVYRSRLLASYEKIIDNVTNKNRNNISGQIDMFSSFSASTSTPEVEYPDIPDYSLKEKLMLEKECSGMYFSGHLIDSYSKHIEALSASPMVDVLTLTDSKSGKEISERQKIRVAGLISSVSVKNTRKNERMAFFTIEDRYSEIECIAFARQYESFYHLIRVDGAVSVEGNISVREDEPPKILVSSIEELVENTKFDEKKPAVDNSPKQAVGGTAEKKQTRLFLRVPKIGSDEFRRAESAIAHASSGNVHVIYYDTEKSEYIQTGRGVDPTPELISKLERFIGKVNVVLK